MQPVPDPYRQLGVQRGATRVQIKAAHRTLAKRFHPDAPDGDATRFLAIQEAYLLLSDPLRRRDWDARHAPGPVRAGDAPQGRATRSRAASGRWTREDAEANARHTRAPGSGRASAGRGTAGGPAAGAPGTAGDPPGKGRGATGPKGSASTRGTGAASGATAGEEDTRRADSSWTQSGRAASSRSYTWSAEQVPWWEDFTPRTQAAGPRDPTGGRAQARGPKRSNPGAGSASASEAGPGSSKDPGDASSRSARSAGKASTASAGSQGTASGGVREVPGPGAVPSGPSNTRPAGHEMDVYSRSSGAAWSMAARRYFRKGDADLPSRGVFTYRGTQVVTGAEARQVKEEEARRRSATDDLLRPRPGTKPAPRQAFDHASEPIDRSNRRSQARPAQAAPQSKPDEESDAAASTIPGDDAGASRNASSAARPGPSAQNVAHAGSRPTAVRPAATSRRPEATSDPSTASRDASVGASAIIGAVAALLVTTPIVLMGGVVLSLPIEPLFIAVVLILAALSGGVAAAAWEAGRRRDRPG